ncbi:MAG: hypothetical protein R3344_15360, partial [Acidobacteriota bacterium]|nr:hypothetical protein [Acidobacteriota bacterium]
GADVLARRILPRLVGAAVADSIRNPAEVRALRDALERFVLVGITASTEARFARIVARGRPGDPSTLDELVSREREENQSDPARQQLDATFLLADRVIDNSGTLEELATALDRILDEQGYRR